VVKKAYLLLILVFIILGCKTLNINDDIKENFILFWKYDENLEFNDLHENKLETLRNNYNEYFRIPLSYFDLYYWDEQILVLPLIIVNENNYLEKMKELFLESDYGSIFYSIIINGKIVANGLNRTMPITAQMRAYDNTNYPRVLSKILNENLYLRFVTSFSLRSIIDMPNNDNEILFNMDIFNYFNKYSKIKYGRLEEIFPRIIKSN
jgi:hypothetical protein